VLLSKEAITGAEKPCHILQQQQKGAAQGANDYQLLVLRRK
jgi:hypothetical protein